MSRYVKNLCVVGGEVRALRIRKYVGESYAARAGRIAAMAMMHRTQHFAFYRDGQWDIYHVSGPWPVRSGLTEDAAVMWLIHRGTKS